MDSREVRLVEAVIEMREMLRETTGQSHPVIEALLDADRRRDPATLNWLAATSSGTLQDRYFTAANSPRPRLCLGT